MKQENTHSAAQSPSNMSTANAQLLDPLDSFTDFSEYEQLSYNSPELSPSSKEPQFTARSVSSTPATLPAAQPALTGPSHNYDLYRQQTGIPQGAIANTLAVNSSNAHISQYGFSNDYFSAVSPNEEFIDFGTAPSQRGSFNPSEIDLDLNSPEGEFNNYYPDQANDFVDPSAMITASASVVPTQVGRLWPGMHSQQAALAKSQAQQKQQQQIIQQQRQAALGNQARQQRARASNSPSDPIVEEKISQLLNSMRQSSATTDMDDMNSNNNMTHAQRMRKDEEDMDEDERLLASEEGKKLSSKERRQLRNKVSARAFRSRRKEYIGQLEGEIAAKVNENTDLRSEVRALREENTRLSDLTRMLLSSPSFSGFLDTLSQNPAAAQQAVAPVQPQPQAENRQARKDVNPYAAQQQMQQQHIGLTMIPEQPMDFSLLDLNNDAFFRPQVYSVLSLPEPVIDAEVLSGKTDSFTAHASETQKVELPVLEHAPVATVVVEEESKVVDEEFEADPAFALYHTAPATASKPAELDLSSLLASIPAKPTQYELVIESTISASESDAALRRVNRLCASVDRICSSLESYTLDL